MLTITLPDGQQIGVTLSVMGDKPVTFVSWRSVSGAGWAPLPTSLVSRSTGWDRVEAAVRGLAATTTAHLHQTGQSLD